MLRRFTNLRKLTTKLFRLLVGKLRSLFLKPQSYQDYFKYGNTYIAKQLVVLGTLGLLAVLFLLNWFVIPWAEGTLWIPKIVVNSDKFHSYSGKARVVTENDDLLYAGEIKDGRVTGEGTLYLDEETVIYQGKFYEEAYHGEGGKFDEDGIMVYEGEFSHNRYHGEGTLYQGGEIYYQGEFINNAKHGEGILYQDKDEVYRGQFEDNRFHGEGELYHDNGNLKYRGGFTRGEKEGEGKLYHRDGPLIYQGSFAEGHFDGAGEKYHPDTGRTIYEGEFSESQYHGFGSLYDHELGRLIYEGEFHKGVYSGEGYLYDRRGRNVYEGPFYEGEIDCLRYLNETVDLVRQNFGDEDESHLLEQHFLMEYSQLQVLFALEYQEENLPTVDRIILLGEQELFEAHQGMSMEKLYELFHESDDEAYYPIDEEREIILQLLDRKYLEDLPESWYGMRFSINQDLYIRFYAPEPEDEIQYFEIGGE